MSQSQEYLSPVAGVGAKGVGFFGAGVGFGGAGVGGVGVGFGGAGVGLGGVGVGACGVGTGAGVGSFLQPLTTCQHLPVVHVRSSSIRRRHSTPRYQIGVWFEDVMGSGHDGSGTAQSITSR